MPLLTKKYTNNDYIRAPWKNGLGTTVELAKEGSDPFRWRLSRAMLISSSPFSSFPDYERVLVTLGHQTIWVLHSGGKKRALPSLTPYAFSGALETQVEINSPMEDFNLFCLRGKAEGKIYPTYFRVSREMQLPIAGKEHFIYCVGGHIQVQEPNTSTQATLQTGELLQVSKTDTKEYLNLKAVASDPETVALWVVVHSS